MEVLTKNFLWTPPQSTNMPKYQSVCPLVRTGTPPPSPASECVPHTPEPEVGGHTRLRVRGWGGVPNSDDLRKGLALCLLCARTLPPSSWECMDHPPDLLFYARIQLYLGLTQMEATYTLYIHFGTQTY
jgi:hypothetical protein